MSATKYLQSGCLPLPPPPTLALALALTLGEGSVLLNMEVLECGLTYALFGLEEQLISVHCNILQLLLHQVWCLW